MTLTRLLTWALVVLTAATVTLAVTTGLLRGTMMRADRRRAALTGRWRPLLLEATGPAQTDDVLPLPTRPRERRVVEDIGLALLAAMRGSDHQTLVGVLHRSGLLTRAVAALASGRTRDRQRAARLVGAARWAPALGPLIESCADRSPAVRQATVAALGQLGQSAAVPALLDLLRATDPSARPARRTVPPLLIGSALVQLAPQSVSQLLTALSDPHPAVRQWSVEALGTTGEHPGAPDTLAIVQLLAVEADPGVRQAAVDALAALGTPDACAALLEELISGSLPGRAAAAAGLAELGAPHHTDLLERALRRDPCLARPLTEALARSGPAGTAALDRLAGSAAQHQAPFRTVAAAARFLVPR